MAHGIRDADTAGGGLRGVFGFRIPVDTQLAAQRDVAEQGRRG